MLELVFIEGSRQGESIRLAFDKAWFGRQPTCDVVLPGEGISRVHFYIARQGGDYVLVDNKSTNGTSVNRVRTMTATLRPGDYIAAGPHLMQVREAVGAPLAAFRFVASRKDVEGGAQLIDQPTLYLGRKSICQVQLNDPAVSPVHAEIEHRPDGVWITDRSSGAGVYVNGKRVVSGQINHGDVVAIRPFEILVTLREGVCILDIKDCSGELESAAAKLPGSYREVVPDPNARDAGSAKPSAPIAALPTWMQARAPIWVPTSDILPNRFRLATLLVCLSVSIGWAGYAWASRSYSIYSPGPPAKFHSMADAHFREQLAANHAPSECAACHAGPDRASDSGCRNCHKQEHATQQHQAKKLSCSTCHSEHRGAAVHLAQVGGATCQSGGCHVTVHKDPNLVLANRKQAGATVIAYAVAFEANFQLGADKDSHPQHKDARIPCIACHNDPKGKDPVPPKVMRMRCLSCHGFGPKATLQTRCYSCHFEHKTDEPEKVLASFRFPDTQPQPRLAGNDDRGPLLLLGALAAIPLLYFAAVAGSFRYEYGRFTAKTAADVRLGLAAPSGQIPDGQIKPPLAGATPLPAPAGSKPTDNQTPGGNLRPKIDLDLCVGCGSCVHTCPFNVLEIVNEKAIAARLVDCTGYAACAAECPTEAIQLVAGGAMQTVELPVYDATLETNVPGIYLAGEITGKALIKIAINQGRKVVESILAHRPEPGAQFDVIVVGAGPAGASTALAALQAGLKVLVLEQGTTANTIRNYPRQKFIMAEPVMIPLYGPLWMEDSSKEALLEKWQQIIAATGLVIHEEEKVLSVTRRSGDFLVKSAHGEYQGARVVLAVGRRGSPRKLGVPGEDSPKVSYNLLDADSYQGKAICVIGGGDSGIEAANGLARADLENSVTLVHRGQDFARAKPRNQKKVKKSMDERRLKTFFNSGVTEIRPHAVLIGTPNGVAEINNDYVFVFVGGESPKQFLADCGVEFSNRPLG